MYDVFLSTPCLTLPDLRSLETQNPLLAHPAFAQGCLHLRPGCFLGLNLDQLVANALLHLYPRLAPLPPSLQLPTAPLVSPSPTLPRLQKRHFPDDIFEPVTFRQERATTWLFAAPCPRLVIEGYAPGTLSVAIDKLDGHVHNA
jgi:hypothetical protein